jgi:hypothetical protein
MADEQKRGRNIFDFLMELIEKRYYWILVVVVIVFLGGWGFAHWLAEPGGRVSVWGLFEYTKKLPKSEREIIPTLPPLPTPEPTLPPIPMPTSTPPPTPVPTPIPTPMPIPTPTPTPTPEPEPIPTHDVAVLIVDESNEVNWDLSRKIAVILESRGQSVSTPSIFTDNTGSFEKVFRGDAQEIKRLRLLRYATRIVLGKKSVSFVTNPELQNTITANVAVEIQILSAKTGMMENSLTVTQKGAGFSNADAEKMAIERIVTELQKKL